MSRSLAIHGVAAGRYGRRPTRNAAASTVGIDAARQITVIAGGGGSTDLLVDVIGYYLSARP